MKGCLQATRRVLHQRRDRGGNTHSFPFDTLTKVYRDTVYATQARYQGNPMYPERDPPRNAASDAATAAVAATSPASSSSPRSNVTNHVGNIGVMSPAATPLSEWMEELHRHPHAADGDSDHGHGQHHNHHHDDEHPHHHGGRSSSLSPSAPTRIVRDAHASSHDQHGTGFAAETGESPTTTAMEDEAVRERLRTHMFSGKRGSPQTRGPHARNTGGAAPRHSGVQVDILNMYRSMLREVGRMEDPDTRRNLTAYIRSEFDKHRDVPRKNILKIEWQLNYGKRKLEDLQAMGRHTKFSMMR
ncbi:hypothetical protein ABB37_06209 [Leptomonas pyrrhocoris]|uniref:Complex 1 LYR protein domain-containing protein n=1 Tax=Leptomonas pyrrhocoris TaxID=157538 RepID=A0A0M9FYM7_LEPPY|nr:hypothetical protein ABB37_06209 [Leptomonas pyrrhocoris]KPA78609.1 hypothetical protein ABB37_06209 [Leptomonas pyrrhocoris]|eukprot:XP_015657048.1 hypothetical protein ABB37_06209 [Leptomonas pyrrhocoris]